MWLNNNLKKRAGVYTRAYIAGYAENIQRGVPRPRSHFHHRHRHQRRRRLRRETELGRYARGLEPRRRRTCGTALLGLCRGLGAARTASRPHTE